MIKTEILLLEAFATNCSIKTAASLAKVSLKEAETFLSFNVDAIESRKQDIKETVGVMSPIRRLEILNQITNLGLEGYESYNKKGEIVLVKNPMVSIQAIKCVTELLGTSEPAAVTNTSSNEEKIIREAYKDIREGVESDEEAWKVLKKGFPEHKELVEELIAKSIG